MFEIYKELIREVIPIALETLAYCVPFMIVIVLFFISRVNHQKRQRAKLQALKKYDINILEKSKVRNSTNSHTTIETTGNIINTKTKPKKEGITPNENKSLTPLQDPAIKPKHKLIEEPKKEYNQLVNNKVNRSQSTSIRKPDQNRMILPPSIVEGNSCLTDYLFVNYRLRLPESLDWYPILRIPKKGCIIRSHRYGNSKRRGYKELSFQNSMSRYFSKQFEISGDIRINTGKDTRPFEPDIAIISKTIDYNIRIDIEIDEPYAGISRQPTHCKGEDLLRDAYFTDRGWIVIRFSEYQVHKQELGCLRFIADVINLINLKTTFHSDLKTSSLIKREGLWDIVQAQKWEKERYRENYLNHDFDTTEEKCETKDRDFNDHEANEEKQVIPSYLGTLELDNRIAHNRTNQNSRDSRIKFYPDNHVYTVDGRPVPSATSILNKFFPEFDAVYWAEMKSSHNGMNPMDILKQWKTEGETAASEGTFLHKQIENYFLGLEYLWSAEIILFEEFMNDHKTIKPYRTEWRVFDEDYNIAGTIDLITKNNSGFEIYDWKRSRKIVDSKGNPITDNNFDRTGVGFLSDLPDTSYNRYCLQQSLYRYIIESKYNISINNAYLVILHPDYDKYYKIDTPYWRDRIRYILNAL